jgi:uncharacterized protein
MIYQILRGVRKMSYQKTTMSSVKEFMKWITKKCGDEHANWAVNFNTCFANTLETTVEKLEDGTTFLLTGDIPAMWLRDSTAQVRPYLVLAEKDEEMANMIAGLIERQCQYICLDPYANAFNKEANGAGHQTDLTTMNPWIWERKYEIDSLCYPIQLSYLFWKATGRTNHFNQSFQEAVQKIIEVWMIEQDHTNSSYTFERVTDRQEDTLINKGRGADVVPTGMTWSGFRPSDDACTYGYLVPSNMFASVVLGYLIEIYEDVLKITEQVPVFQKLKEEIEKGIEEFAVVRNQNGEEIYAYEVDGKGNFTIMDDSNIPNLLSAPYLGYVEENDERYRATRQTILSKENPYFYKGKYAEGIGSSHTPENYIWPIALAMEGLTAEDKKEKERILDLLVACDGGTHLMHEGFNVDDPSQYTREWFSWANMMFCELVMDYFDIRVKKK